MPSKSRYAWLFIGLAVGLAAGWFVFSDAKTVLAGYDRNDEFILTSAPLATGIAGLPDLDGIWMLDQRQGKLLASIASASGRIGGWAEVDLLREFGVPARNASRFLISTGSIAGRSVLFVAESTTGKFGVYGITTVGNGEIIVRRYDMVSFRAAAPTPMEPSKPTDK